VSSVFSADGSYSILNLKGYCSEPSIVQRLWHSGLCHEVFWMYTNVVEDYAATLEMVACSSKTLFCNMMRYNSEGRSL
jgi:hypothetical protein